jgi:CRISPR-associated protein Csm3
MPTGKFFGKVIIEGTIECLTGMHIGGGRDVSDIGGIDMPVVRDPMTREPYIPGSSLKGKMRSLLEKQEFAVLDPVHNDVKDYFSKRVSDLRHHECNDPKCIVCRLFGASTGSGVKENRPALLKASDASLTDESREILSKLDTGLYMTELKFENTLDRITSAASPRQIERVPRGTEFRLWLTYDQDEERASQLYKDDLKAIFNCLKLINDDALGGSVSRGYGRIGIKGLKATYRLLDYYRNTMIGNEQQIAMDDGDLASFEGKVLQVLTS